ncbi:unnamed protein product [Symbiodinium sp. CCMP2456]|nr:unnamed protein product [Symbiodinium sp. CCMP2456]
MTGDENEGADDDVDVDDEDEEDVHTVRSAESFIGKEMNIPVHEHVSPVAQAVQPSLIWRCGRSTITIATRECRRRMRKLTREWSSCFALYLPGSAHFSTATPAEGARSKEEKEEEEEESALAGSRMKLFEGTWQDRAGCIYRILQTSAPWRSQGHYIVEKYSGTGRANYCLSFRDGRVWWGVQRYWARWDGDFICWYDSHQRDSLAFSWKRVADLQGTLQSPR